MLLGNVKDDDLHTMSLDLHTMSFARRQK